jgi:hypothetical protein
VVVFLLIIAIAVPLIMQAHALCDRAGDSGAIGGLGIEEEELVLLTDASDRAHSEVCARHERGRDLVE